MNHKCRKCGSSFKYPSYLKRHLIRKNSCIVAGSLKSQFLNNSMTNLSSDPNNLSSNSANLTSDPNNLSSNSANSSSYSNFSNLSSDLSDLTSNSELRKRKKIIAYKQYQTSKT